MSPRANEVQVNNTPTTPNEFDLKTIFDVTMWLSLRDAVSFLTVNKAHNTLLKKDNFWAQKVGALNFLDFLLRMNELTNKTLQNSALASCIKITDAETTQELLQISRSDRCLMFFRYCSENERKNYLFTDACIILIREGLITAAQLRGKPLAPRLLGDIFVVSALRDKLIRVDDLLDLAPLEEEKKYNTKEIIFSHVIIPTLQKIVKKKFGNNIFMNQYGSNPTHYAISVTDISEARRDRIYQQFLDFGINAEQKKEDSFFQIVLNNISAINLKTLLQKMPMMEPDAKENSKKLDSQTHTLFHHEKTTMKATYYPPLTPWEKQRLRQKAERYEH